MKFTIHFVFFAFCDCAFPAAFPLFLQTRIMVCGRLLTLEIVDIAFLFETQLVILMDRSRRNRNKFNSILKFNLCSCLPTHNCTPCYRPIPHLTSLPLVLCNESALLKVIIRRFNITHSININTSIKKQSPGQPRKPLYSTFSTVSNAQRTPDTPQPVFPARILRWLFSFPS